MAGIFGLLMSGAGVIKDQYYNLTSLLLPGNGTDGKQNRTFLDSSGQNGGAGWTITPNGNATQGTFSPFSQTGWGNYFNGSSSILETSTSIFGTWSTANASTTTATIEAMVYVNALQSAPANAYQNPSIINKGNTYLNFSVNSTGNIVFFHYDGSFRYITSTGTIQANTWNYVAVTITGGTATIYINGTSSGSGTWYGIQTGGLVAPTYIGQTPTGQYWNGYISNLRVSSTVRTIATPLVPYTNDGNTSLLTCQSNRFRDASTNGYTITATGSPSVTPFSPFAPTQSYSAAAVGGSGYFDGTGDYLTWTGTAAGSGAFSYEFWIYSTNGFGTFRAPLGVIATSGYNSALDCRMSGTTITAGQYNVTNNNFTVESLQANTWYHVVICRNASNQMTVFLNGQRSSTGALTISTNFSGLTSAIGRLDPSNGGDVTGYITNVRLITGSTPYDPTQTSITVPTSPPTAITNTQLLLNFTNAGVVDATAKNVLETVGNAQISTTQSKWGGGSISFDGNGDYIPQYGLLLPTTGDFTVEAWIRVDSLSATRTIFGCGSAGTKLAFYVGTSGLVGVQTGSAYLESAGSLIATNTWYHVALTRTSNTYKIFVDGTERTLSGAGTMLTTISNSPQVVGAFSDTFGGSPFSGYMDDFRISMFRRYTSNFTAPTAPFPVQ